jgi:hypothetical protein
MPAVDVVDVVDAFDVFDAQPARSLRRACVFGAIDQLDTRLDTQLDRFFDFPVSLNFCLGSSTCPSNAIKKIIT